MTKTKLNIDKIVSTANKALKPVLFILFFAASYQIGSAVYFMWLSPSLQTNPLEVARPNRGQQWSWFQAERKSKATPKVTESVTKARLNAKLKGIVELGERSLAIIDLGRKNETSVFGVGDKLASNVTIESIESRRVLIREQGQLRELVMEEKGLEMEVSDNIPQSENVGRSLSDVANINSSVLAGVSFVQTDNGDTGMSLGSINPSMLEGTDLQADDVLLSAGGTTVEQILSSPMSYQSLLRSDSLDITVMRNGAEEIININPRSVAPNIMRMIGQNR